MWHEARRQERKIRVMMVDRKRRADRRRQYYENAKQVPTQFLRLQGRQCKIHWEHSVALAAEAPQTMMPWQGDSEIQIDRFDVRSHLDHYVEPKNTEEELGEVEQDEARKCNYERYRILVQNDVAGVGEDQCLKQIHIDELYGAIETPNSKKAEEDKKKNANKKAAIGFTYEDSTGPGNKQKEVVKEEASDSEESELDEMDMDNTIDMYNLSLDEVALLNECSVIYGMEGNDFYDNMEVDKDEAEALRLAKIVEEEKAQFSGRKSRRERRAFKERRLKDKPNSPPAFQPFLTDGYAARDSPKYEPYKKGTVSRSRSRSPERPEQFAFITSFGGDSEEVVQGPNLPPHLLPKGVRNKMMATRRKSRSRSKDRGATTASARIGRLKALRGRASKSPTRSRSKSPDHKRDRSDRSRSRRSRSRSRSKRSRSRSKGRRSWGQRSGSRSRRSRSRSRGRRSRSRSRRSRSRSRGRNSRNRRSSSRSNRNSRSSRGRRSSSRSRSRSSSYSRSRSSSRSSSRSPLKPEPVIKSYRRPSLSSNSGMSGSDSDSDAKSKRDDYGYKGKKDLYQSKMSRGSAADKMKLRMQKALKRQFKADQKAQLEKEYKVNQQRQDREDELRALAIQMRRREREKRHREETNDDSCSRSTSRSPPPRKKSRSKSPPKRRSRSPRRDSNGRGKPQDIDERRPRDDPRRVDPRRDEPRRDEPRRDDRFRDEHRRDDPRSNDPRRDDRFRDDRRDRERERARERERERERNRTQDRRPDPRRQESKMPKLVDY